MRKDKLDRRDAKTVLNLMMRYSPVTIAIAMASAAELCADDSVSFSRQSGVEEAAYAPVMRSFAAQLTQVAEIMLDSVEMLQAVTQAGPPSDSRSTRTDARDTRPLRD